MTLQDADNEWMREKYPYRMRDNIAIHLERNVCLCHEPGRLVPHPVHHMCVCEVCSKPKVYFIYHCSNCDKDFLHDFILNFCIRRPLCWECNYEDNWQCSNHTYCTTNVHPNSIRPPVFELKPAFTKEDLQGVFPFDY